MTLLQSLGFFSQTYFLGKNLRTNDDFNSRSRTARKNDDLKSNSNIIGKVMILLETQALFRKTRCAES